MLLNGVNHVALLTNDTERLVAFYRDVFEAVVERQIQEREGVRLTFLRIGELTEMNVFEVSLTISAPSLRRRNVDMLPTSCSDI